MMRNPGSAWYAARAVVLLAALVAVASCGTSSPASSPPSRSAAAPAGSTSAGSAPSPAPSPPAAAPVAGCGTARWQTAPAGVTRQVSVPPVPVITAVRTAAHPECGYDRLVLDISGPVPGYTIAYAKSVTADPSGQAITVPGQRYLVLTLRPAKAHTGSGAATITPRARVLGYPMLKGYALAGDFEGVVTVALGLREATSIRVGQLPGHLYLDVKA
jgi:predicted small lipoprotein YifL